MPVTLALVESPAGFLVQQRPQKGLLAGLWQPVLWEGEHLLQAEVLARLAALGLAMSGQAGSSCAPPTPCLGRSGRISRCCCDFGNLL